MNNFFVPTEADFMVPEGSVMVLAVIVFGGVLWLWSIVDALRTGDGKWTAADQSKLVWVVTIILLGPLGALLYLVIAKPSLRRVRS